MRVRWRARLPRAGSMLLLAACIVCYANGLTGDFTYDDKAIVRDNPRIRAPAGLVSIFTTPYFGGPRGQGTGYRPILLVSYAVQWWMHGDSAFGFHVVNVGLHALATLLLARFLARILVPPPVAFGAALLFAVHPIHVEAVTSLVGRGETLAAVFVLAMLLASLRYREDPRPRFVLASLFLYLLAILAKESAAVAPALSLLAAWRLETGDARSRVKNATRRWLPIAVGSALLLAGAFVVRRAVLGGAIKAATFRIFELENPLAPLPVWERVPNAAAILVRYVGRLLFPVRLSADESAWSIPVERGFYAWGVAAMILIAAVLLAAIAREREKRDLAFGVLFFFGAFAATANVFFAIGTILAERVAYLPSAGFALATSSLLLGTAPASTLSRRRVFALLAIVGAFGARTIVRNPAWKDDETLFANTVRTSPDSAKAHYNFAWVCAARGQLDAALAEYTRATEIYPKYFDAWAGKGLIEQRLGNLPEAEASFRRSLAVAPRYENGFFRLGAVLEMRGDLAGAERAFAEGLAKNPKSTPLAFRLAKIRARLERPSADADWQRAISIARGAASFQLGYAKWLMDRGRSADARRAAREVLRRRPRETAALAILAESSRSAGRRFSEGMAVEKIFRATRSQDDLDRLARIATEDPAYAIRFAAVEPALRKLLGQ